MAQIHFHPFINGSFSLNEVQAEHSLQSLLQFLVLSQAAVLEEQHIQECPIASASSAVSRFAEYMSSFAFPSPINRGRR